MVCSILNFLHHKDLIQVSRVSKFFYQEITGKHVKGNELTNLDSKFDFLRAKYIAPFKQANVEAEKIIPYLEIHGLMCSKNRQSTIKLRVNENGWILSLNGWYHGLRTHVNLVPIYFYGHSVLNDITPTLSMYQIRINGFLGASKIEEAEKAFSIYSIDEDSIPLTAVSGCRKSSSHLNQVNHQMELLIQKLNFLAGKAFNQYQKLLEEEKEVIKKRRRDLEIEPWATFMILKLQPDYLEGNDYLN